MESALATLKTEQLKAKYGERHSPFCAPSRSPTAANPCHGEPQNLMHQGRMDDTPGMPGTRGGLTLHLNQFVFALVADLAHGVWCFSCFVNAVSLQCLRSLSLAFVDLYAILVKRRLRNPKVVSVFAFGDEVLHLPVSQSLTAMIYTLVCVIVAQRIRHL